MLPVRVGTRVEFPNLDDTYHNIFSYSPAKRFDLVMGVNARAAFCASRAVLPAMQALAAQVGESCSAAVLEGSDIIYVMRVPTHKIMSIGLGVGSRLPAYCTSMGRMLLADLDDAKALAVLAEEFFKTGFFARDWVLKISKDWSEGNAADPLLARMTMALPSLEHLLRLRVPRSCLH